MVDSLTLRKSITALDLFTFCFSFFFFLVLHLRHMFEVPRLGVELEL